jgi:hypothetical protein
MKDMMLFVPTHNRLDYQLTLKNLPMNWKERTVVVCPREEIHPIHRMFPNLYEICSPDKKSGASIAAKRKWIFEYAGEMEWEKIMMFDDDLKFSARLHVHASYGGYQQGNPKKWPDIVKKDRTFGRIHDATPRQIDLMLLGIEKMLDTYRHGGISQRFMNHVHGHEFILNHKATHALAYHVPTVLAHCKLGRVRMFEDLDYTLQLLRAGFENAIYQWGATNDPRGFNATGGESGSRTSHDISYGADLMAKLHPGIVRVVERAAEDAVRLGPKRIVVAWKKAIKEGKDK